MIKRLNARTARRTSVSRVASSGIKGYLVKLLRKRDLRVGATKSELINAQSAKFPSKRTKGASI